MVLMLLNAYRIDPLMTRIHDHPRAAFDSSATARWHAMQAYPFDALAKNDGALFGSSGRSAAREETITGALQYPAVKENSYRCAWRTLAVLASDSRHPVEVARPTYGIPWHRRGGIGRRGVDPNSRLREGV
jgi:hypothetical protein